MAGPKKYPDELVQRRVRLALQSGRPIAHVAADLRMHPETLRKRLRQAQANNRASRRGGHRKVGLKAHRAKPPCPACVPRKPLSQSADRRS